MLVQFFWALGAREEDDFPGGPGAFPSCKRLLCLRSCPAKTTHRPFSFRDAPDPSAFLRTEGGPGGGGPVIGSAPAPPARPARSWASLVRLREPRTRSSHDGGCSRRRRTRGARWGRRARGRRGPGANVSLCVSPFPSSPSGAPRRRAQQEGLDDGPDFLSEEDRGVSCAFCRVGAPLPSPPWPEEGSGLLRCCRAAPSRPRRRAPRPSAALLPRGRALLGAACSPWAGDPTLC